MLTCCLWAPHLSRIGCWLICQGVWLGVKGISQVSVESQCFWPPISPFKKGSLLDWVFRSSETPFFSGDANAKKEVSSFVKAKKGAVKWMRMSVPHSLVQKIKIRRGLEAVRVILYTFQLLSYRYNADS